jgi:hypothetical protein
MTIVLYGKIRKTSQHADGFQQLNQIRRSV